RFTLIFFLFLSVIINAQITFEEHTIDDHEYGVSSVCAADINGDGFIDVIDSGHDVNRISYYQNDGSTPITFTKQIVDFTFTGAIFVDAADVNGDGNVDILGAAWEGNEIAYWLNDGNAPINWTKVSVDDTFNGAHEVKAADVNSDGFTDILGASAENHQIAMWLNDGSQPVNWTKTIISGQFLGARSVECYDINNDGHNDVIGAALTSDEVIVWFNNGESPITWNEQIVDSEFDGSHWVHCTDFDNDGDGDIFGAAAIGDDIAWWRNEGGDPITWTKQTITSFFEAALSVSTADLDGDGDIDAFGAATTADRVMWWRNDGGDPIQWTGFNIQTNFDEAWGLFGTDIDSDGDADILATAATDNEVTWWENKTATGIDDEYEIPINFELKQNYPNPFNPSTVIRFHLNTYSYVVLKVYDLLGNEVETLVDEERSAGYYEAEFNAVNLASGVYLYSLQARQFSQVRKMILIK
ncbi:FG-GAP-like repeat-containing protein, partial [Bacteroidota bacterium]